MIIYFTIQIWYLLGVCVPQQDAFSLHAYDHAVYSWLPRMETEFITSDSQQKLRLENKLSEIKYSFKQQNMLNNENQ